MGFTVGDQRIVDEIRELRAIAYESEYAAFGLVFLVEAWDGLRQVCPGGEEARSESSG